MRWKQSPRPFDVAQGGPERGRTGRSSTIAQGGLDPRRTGRAQRVLSLRWLRGGKLIWACNLALAALLACVLWGILAHRANALKLASVRHPGPVAKARAPIEPTPADASGGGSLFIEAGTKSPDNDVAAATQLSLKLLGTIAGDPPWARAIIEDTHARSQKIYHLGDMVAGARIEEIGRSSVVLRVNDRRELLEMSQDSGRDTAPQPYAPATGRPTPTGSITDVFTSTAARSFKVSREGLLTRIGGYESVMKAIQEKIKPYDDGKVKGLQINGLDDISMATFLDLQNGDVIQSVNGQNLNNLQKAWQVWQKARHQPDLDVQIMRGDSPRTLHFSLSSN